MLFIAQDPHDAANADILGDSYFVLFALRQHVTCVVFAATTDVAALNHGSTTDVAANDCFCCHD